MIASLALSTWSLEQQKSVKSPIETGRCIVASAMGTVLDGGREAAGWEDRRAWRTVRVLVWADLGRAAKALRVGWFLSGYWNKAGNIA